MKYAVLETNQGGNEETTDLIRSRSRASCSWLQECGHEQEVLKCHNDQLMEQITILQTLKHKCRRKASPESEEPRPIAYHKFKAAQINILLHQDYSDNEAESPHSRTEAYHHQTQRRLAGSSNIWSLDSWSKDRSRRLNFSSIADQHLQLPESLTLLSPKRSWSASFRESSQLQPLTTTSECVNRSSTSGTFGIRWWSTPTMIRLYA